MNLKPLQFKDNLTRQERITLSKLFKRKDIIVKPADKGSATVVMDTDKYLDECYRQLYDKKFYT